MNKSSDPRAAGAPVPRPLQQARQMTLGLFPTAPGRVVSAAPAVAPAPLRLRQAERAGDHQRSLPIRPVALAASGD